MSEYNIFKKILKDLPAGEIEIIPHNEKDKEIAKQMTILVNLKRKEEKEASDE